LLYSWQTPATTPVFDHKFWSLHFFAGSKLVAFS